MRKKSQENQSRTGHDGGKRNKEEKVSNMLPGLVRIDGLTRSKKDGKVS